MEYRFREFSDGYTIRAAFTVPGGQVGAIGDCLVTALFDPAHMRRYYRHLAAIREDQPATPKTDAAGNRIFEQVLTYQYRSLFYDTDSTFLRRLDPVRRRLDFELIRIQQSGMITPDIRQIRGHYQVLPGPRGWRVSFQLDGKVTGAVLGGFYRSAAGSESAAYLKNLRTYALSTCSGH